MKAHHEGIVAMIEANQTKLESEMKSYPERMEANCGKLEAGQEESTANQEKKEAVAEHCKRVPRVLTAPQGRASDVLRGAPKRPTFEKR
jgi:hypothetical protein